MTYTDASYQDAFANWMHCVTQVARSAAAVIALDELTAEYFHGAGAAVIFAYDSRANTTQESSRAVANQETGGVLYMKGAFTRRLLDQGLRVIFSELDIFWLADPLLVEDRSVDIQVAQQGYTGDVINSGFWIAQPTIAARALFKRMERWFLSPHYFPCNDQHYYNMAVRWAAPTLRAMAVNCRPRNISAALHMLGGHLRWKHIPLQLMPHPFKFFKSGPQQPPWDVISFGGAIAVHLWRTIAGNPPAQRIQCARRMASGPCHRRTCQGWLLTFRRRTPVSNCTRRAKAFRYHIAWRSLKCSRDCPRRRETHASGELNASSSGPLLSWAILTIR